MQRFIIISPDGFPIHPEKTYTVQEIPIAFENWKKRYEQQGYYSSTNYGRIPLDDLEDYCELKKDTHVLI